jgi:hypothetical protein
MFVKWSDLTIAADNYCDTVNLPIADVTRKQSIASYNYPQKTVFFSHINKIVVEPMDVDIRLVTLMAVNSLGEVYRVVCSEDTSIAVLRGRFTTFAKISELRSSSSILIDENGYLCKIISIDPYFDKEDVVIDVKSNKGNSKFVNGLMFRA